MTTNHSHANITGLKSYDLFVVLFWIIYALIYFIGEWKGAYPVTLFVNGDTQDICGYVQVLNNPDFFRNDAILYDPNNVKFYTTLHIPLLRMLTSITGDCGLSFYILSPLLIIIQACGFYLLGRLLFQNHLWAFMLSSVSLASILLYLDTFWGIFGEPLPRTLFQSFLPYLLFLTIKWRNSQSRWYWIAFFLGLSTYLHPISAIIWTLVVMFSLYFFTPKLWSTARRLRFLLSLGLIYLIASSLFFYNFLSHSDYGSLNNQTEIMSIIRNELPLYFNLSLSIFLFLKLFFVKLFLPAFLSIIFLFFYVKNDRATWKMIVIWILGLFCFSIVIPALTIFAYENSQNIPFSLGLSRNIRYIIPLCFIVILWALKELRFYLTLKASIFTHTLVTIILCVLLLPPLTPIIKTINAWHKGMLLPSEEQHSIFNRMNLKKISSLVPKDDLVFVAGGIDPLLVRSVSLRPVPYTFKDNSVLMYANPNGLIRWSKIKHELESIKPSIENLASFIDLARRHNSRFLILGFNVEKEELLGLDNVRLVYKNYFNEENKQKRHFFVLLKL